MKNAKTLRAISEELNTKRNVEAQITHEGTMIVTFKNKDVKDKIMNLMHVKYSNIFMYHAFDGLSGDAFEYDLRANHKNHFASFAEKIEVTDEMQLAVLQKLAIDKIEKYEAKWSKSSEDHIERLVRDFDDLDKLTVYFTKR